MKKIIYCKNLKSNERNEADMRKYELIQSEQNQWLKKCKALQQKKYRQEYKEFIVEGIKMVEEAIQENAKIKSIIICDDCKTQGSIPNELMYDIAKLNCIYVAEKIFSTITDVINPQGIMAIIEKKEEKLDELVAELIETKEESNKRTAQDNFIFLFIFYSSSNIGLISNSSPGTYSLQIGSLPVLI